jgi:DNA-binding transcriptional LysR family regulator
MHRPGIANWDDLRFVLAVADLGSVSAAARSLGVNHATVLRRIAAFEQAEGTQVFDRGPQGYAVPPDRQRIIDAAREAAAAMEGVSRTIRASMAPAEQAVRVTSTDTFCHLVLPVIVADMAADPHLPPILLICANGHLDLGRTGADITVRPAVRLPPDLVGDPAADLGFAVYQAPGGADHWLTLHGALARVASAQWMQDHLPAAALRGGADSFLVLAELAQRGQGHAVLPCIIGDAIPGLHRVITDMPLPPVPIWVASHADLANVPRLALVRAALTAGLRSQAARLRG